MSSTATVRAGLQRRAHAAQQRHDLLAGEVVDDVEHQRAVVGAAEIGLEHVAVAMRRRGRSCRPRR